MGLCLIVLAGLWLSGCGKKEAWEKWNRGQLSLDQDGQIIFCVVESFGKNYYDLDELKGMAVKEVAEFNGKNKTGEGTPASVLEVAMLEGNSGMVRVVWKFNGPQSFAAFQGENFYYETLEEAVEQKHVFTGSMLYNGEDSIALDEINKVKYRTKHVLITDVKSVIHLPFEVLYYGPGVVLNKDGSIDTTACEDAAVVILKK